MDVDYAVDTPWHKMIKKALPPLIEPHSDPVLEIGCGGGGFSMCFSEQWSDVRLIAADFSKEAVAKGNPAVRSSKGTSIHWMLADAEQIPIQEEHIGMVISCETVEHVPHSKLAIQEFFPILRSGGYLLITTPNCLGLMSLYRAYRRVHGRPFTEVGQPINHFTFLPRTLNWIRNAGFVIQHFETRGHYLPWPGRQPIEMTQIIGGHLANRWFGLHSMIQAVKE